MNGYLEGHPSPGSGNHELLSAQASGTGAGEERSGCSKEGKKEGNEVKDRATEKREKKRERKIKIKIKIKIIIIIKITERERERERAVGTRSQATARTPYAPFVRSGNAEVVR